MVLIKNGGEALVTTRFEIALTSYQIAQGADLNQLADTLTRVGDGSDEGLELSIGSYAHLVREFTKAFFSNMVFQAALEEASLFDLSVESVHIGSFDSLEDQRIRNWEIVATHLCIASKIDRTETFIAKHATALVVAYLQTLFGHFGYEYDETFNAVYDLGVVPDLPDTISFLSPLRVVVLEYHHSAPLGR